MKFNHTDKIGEIVTRFPKAADVFQKYNIDYCCGGKDSLENAAKDLAIDAQSIILELDSYFLKSSNNESADWTQAPFQALINQILQAHHAYLHTNLSPISELTKTILRAHGANHPELLKVFQDFNTLKSELEVHLIKEETIQYPAIEKYLDTLDKNDLKSAVDVISELESEHTVAGDLLKSLRTITNNYQVPHDGCNTYRHAYLKLEELEKNTFTHIHLENNILFPRLKELL